MLEETGSKFKIHRWNLFGREVESPHTSAMFSRSSHLSKPYFYNGKPQTIHEYTPPLCEAADLVNDIIAKDDLERAKRGHRYPLESSCVWTGDMVAANCYRGAAESVGAHADAVSTVRPRQFPTSR